MTKIARRERINVGICDEVASQSPFAAYVVKNYRDCLHPGYFSAGSEGQCKVAVAQLVRIEKGEADVQEAMRIIGAYELKKQQALQKLMK